MADTTLRTDLDQIATALEKKGRADLASVVDLCNHQIHDRKARASVAKPMRQAATGTDRKSKLRWAATELKAIARDLRKEGSVREAREFLKMADDLMEEIAVEGPVVEGEEPIEGAELEVEDDESESEPDADDECPPCPPCDDEPLESVEACARELRALAREMRASKNPQDKVTARALLRQAMELEVDPALGTQPVALPPTDGGSDPVDATDFDLSDVPLPELGDEDGGGDVEDIISDEIMDLEGGEPAGMSDIEANPETTPSEYVEAALSLARAAVTLEKAGQKVQAAKLIAKAKEFRAAAVRKASAAKRPTVASRKPAPKLSPREAAKARFLARSQNR